MSEPTVKSYSNKSKAKRALGSIGITDDAQIDKLLFQYGDDAKWSFYEDDARRMAEVNKETPPAPPAPEPSNNSAVQPDQAGDQAPIETQVTTGTGDPEPGDQGTSETPVSEAPAVGAFGALASGLANGAVTAPATPAPRAASRTSYTIEKNRVKQNGITRPSAGGLCRSVWDACDDLRTKNDGAVPTSADIRTLAAEKGWNKNNAMIEFYQWRKFNGITGRTPKADVPADVPQAPTEVHPALVQAPQTENAPDEPFPVDPNGVMGSAANSAPAEFPVD